MICSYIILLVKFLIFLKNEIIQSIVDLTNIYDLLIMQNENLINEFYNDLLPLYELIKNLFKNADHSYKFNLFCKFYSNIFNLKSKGLNNGNLKNC